MGKLETLNTYYEPSHAGTYGGQDVFRRASRLPLRRVRSWLLSQDAYTLHRPVRRRFIRRPTIVSGPGVQWQADLADLNSLARHNSGRKYLLTVIDVFSKVAHVRALRSKTGKEIVQAFGDILRHSQVTPKYLQTDKGTEFKNKHFQGFLKQHQINFFTTENEDTKAAIIERFHRTFKSKMYRYFTANGTKRYVDVLESLVKNYNSTYHRSIQTQPRLVGVDNLHLVHRALYDKHDARAIKSKFLAPSLKAGDRVRIARSKVAFDKGFLPAWTRELFTVQRRVNRTHPYIYTIVDDAGERVRGTFYEPELQRVEDTGVYAVEKIVRRRRDHVLVKWLGYSDNFNSWIPRKEVRHYKNVRLLTESTQSP